MQEHEDSPPHPEAPPPPDGVRRLRAVPLSDTIGAELRRCDLTAASRDAHLFGQLSALLLRHKVLLVRNQDISGDELLELARRFGPVEDAPSARMVPRSPGLVRLGGEPFGLAPCDQGYHFEASWREIPPMVCILRCIEAPAAGCDMVWANMAQAYRRLPAELRSRTTGLRARHSIAAALPDALPAEERRALRGRYLGAEHPVVRIHPETGESVLFVDAFTTHLVDRGPTGDVRDTGPTSDDLLAQLLRQAAASQIQVRMRLTAGSVAIWDNRSAQHYAAPARGRGTVRFERVRIVGGDVG